MDCEYAWIQAIGLQYKFHCDPHYGHLILDFGREQPECAPLNLFR